MPFLETEFTIMQNIRRDPVMESGVEVFLCVLGSGTASCAGRTFRAERGDLFAVFPGEKYSLDFPGSAAVGRAFCSYQMFTAICGTADRRFYCNSVLDVAHSYTGIRQTMEALVQRELHEARPSEAKTASLIIDLIDRICTELGEADTDGIKGGESDDAGRIRRIISYVDQHYQEKISLHELADEMFLSVSSLSRLFRKQSGMLFSDYVRKVRLEKASRILREGSESVTRISIDCGFGSPASFTRAFEAYFGCTPAAFRQKADADTISGPEKEQTAAGFSAAVLDDEERSAMMERIRSAVEEVPAPEESPFRVRADVRNGTGYKKNWNRVINIGPARELALNGVQNHIRILHEELSFRYVRIWNIFSKKLMITDGNTIGQYNYHMLDEILDFLVAEHIYPFMDFGVRPDAALTAPGNYIFFENENIEFASRRVWEAIMSDFIRHIISRYGAEEVSHWIFECTRGFGRGNTHYYNGEDYDFGDVFSYIRGLLKRVLPDALFGGPMISVTREEIRDLDVFLDMVRQRNCPPDFVSLMLLPAVWSDDSMSGEAKRRYECDFIHSVRRAMTEKGFGNTALFVSEWNNSISSRDYLNDSCFRGIYFVDRIRQIWDQADVLAPWIGTDLVSNYYDSDRLANGGNGLLAKNGIRKPVFNAFGFLNMMGEYLLAKGEGYIMTRSARGSIYCLLYRYQDPSGAYARMGAQVASPELLGNVFGEGAARTAEITVTGLVRDAEYIVKTRLISDADGTILSEWKRFGYESRLTEEEVSYIRNACYPRIRMERYAARDGRIVIEVPLRKLEIMLIHIRRDVEDMYDDHL